jgi:hypothetical protein
MKTLLITALIILITFINNAQSPIVKEVKIEPITFEIKKLPDTNKISTTYESLGWILVEKKGKYGFIDSTGRESTRCLRPFL